MYCIEKDRLCRASENCVEKRINRRYYVPYPNKNGISV
jgi:hypothetical protein